MCAARSTCHTVSTRQVSPRSAFSPQTFHAPKSADAKRRYVCARGYPAGLTTREPSCVQTACSVWTPSWLSKPRLSHLSSSPSDSSSCVLWSSKGGFRSLQKSPVFQVPENPDALPLSALRVALLVECAHRLLFENGASQPKTTLDGVGFLSLRGITSATGLLRGLIPPPGEA